MKLQPDSEKQHVLPLPHERYFTKPDKKEKVEIPKLEELKHNPFAGLLKLTKEKNENSNRKI